MLFDDLTPVDRRREPGADAPLAERLRPASLDEVVGQRDVVGPEGFLRRAIAEDRVPSMILWGPPGSGKTTLARIVARATASRFVPFSAVTSGIKEVKQVMGDAERLRRGDGTGSGRRTLVFVDEIHRFNKAQQDAFLPYVERGDIVLVGATTENPSFEVNPALLSRCRVVVLAPLSPPELDVLLDRALADRERGLGASGVELAPDARAALVQLASGDARKLYNLLELVVADAVSSRQSDRKRSTGGSSATTAAEGGTAGGDPPTAPDPVAVGAPADRLRPEGRGRSTERARATIVVKQEAVAQVAQRKVLLYDKAGEEHFNLISALHKSLRESDPDAAVYWLARMLEAGEEPLYLARRMVRFASEDVGLADPRALRLTLDAWEAYHRLGSPEGELALAQAVIYLAVAPKSNAVYRAFGAAKKTVAERPADPVPKVIRNAPTRLMKEEGYGAGYVYAHDTAEGVGGLECLPEALAGTRFYAPTTHGVEERIRRRLEELGRLRESSRGSSS